MDELYEAFGLFPPVDNPLYGDISEFRVKRITAKMLAEMEVAEQAACQIEGNILENWNQKKTVDSRIREELEKRFGFVYPYEYRKDIPG